MPYSYIVGCRCRRDSLRLHPLYGGSRAVDELRGRDHRQVRRDNGLTATREHKVPRIQWRQDRLSAYLAAAILDPEDESDHSSALLGLVSRHGPCSLDGKPVWCSPVRRRCDKIMPAEMAAAITPRSRLFLLNSPWNPTRARTCVLSSSPLARCCLAHPCIPVIGTDDMGTRISIGVPSRFAASSQPCPHSMTGNCDDQRLLEGLRYYRLAHRILRRTPGSHSYDGDY